MIPASTLACAKLSGGQNRNYTILSFVWSSRSKQCDGEKCIETAIASGTRQTSMGTNDKWGLFGLRACSSS